DGLLAVAGRLNGEEGGRPVDIFTQPFTTKRTVYGFIDRQDLPGTFRVFDFASPDVSTPQRPQTTVPQQALYSMNSPFVIEQARAVAARAIAAASASATSAAGDPVAEVQARIRDVYRQILARLPDPAESESATRFVLDVGDSQPALDQLSQALLLSNEFEFVD
ncbi:MAG: DUF1553 domain-containing protein, partial [Planctomycetota bacterium]|nr:DUF1553 domain-containing protein [Planctomycetota bacterium]